MRIFSTNVFLLIAFAFTLIVSCNNNSGNKYAKGLIVFVAEDAASGELRLHQMNPDGTGIQLLDYSSNGRDLAVLPTISPNGSKIANQYRDTLYLAGLKQSSPNMITEFEIISQFSWSYNASKIAFTGYRNTTNGQQSGLFTANADGGNVQFVTELALFRYLGNWSPDGQQIVFAEQSINSQQYDIYVINADGTGKTRLTSDSAEEYSPIFSPNGSKILFTVIDRDTTPNTYSYFSMNTDGTEKEKLNNPLGQRLDGVRWSPSGKNIVFYTSKDGGYSIYKAKADGSDPQNLTPDGGYNLRPVWVQELKE